LKNKLGFKIDGIVWKCDESENIIKSIKPL